MAVEAKRGCGYRKVGGIYLVCEGEGRDCGRFPLALNICPACGGGVKQTRGWTWISPEKLFAKQPCGAVESFCAGCPMTDLAALPEAGLLWIGVQFYKTPRHFQMESASMGVCRRITAIPRKFIVGETWVFLAHSLTIPGENEDGDQVMLPGVFNAFLPTSIEQLVTETQAKDKDEMAKLHERGITTVVVPDDDLDHRGTVYDKVTEIDS